MALLQHLVTMNPLWKSFISCWKQDRSQILGSYWKFQILNLKTVECEVSYVQLLQVFHGPLESDIAQHCDRVPWEF